MKVYLAAPWELQADAQAFARELIAVGVDVPARWLEAESEALTDAWATTCLVDIAHCDLLLAWNPEAWARIGTGGRHVELGFALAVGKPVIVVGARTNIFHHLNEVDAVAIGPGAVAGVLAIAATRGLTARRAVGPITGER